MPTRTHVILDGLQDPAVAQQLSRRWALAGFHNAVDVAGQSAWLSPVAEPVNELEATLPKVRAAPSRTAPHERPAALDEAQVEGAASLARAFGLEIRFRVGQTFRPDTHLSELRRQIKHEYRHRFAVALMFGLPAIALHYVGPYLAGIGGPRTMAAPWLCELLLVVWACFAAGWPILWQGALALIHLRPTIDLLTSVIVVGSLAPSAVGILAMPFVCEPWFDPQDNPPMCYATVLILWIAVLQRWLVHRVAGRLRGHTMLMLRGFDRLVLLWLMLILVVVLVAGWRWGLAFGMLLPPCLSMGAINRWSPGWSMAMPVFAFALLLLLVPHALNLHVEGVQIETAAGFGLIMTTTFALGWVRIQPMREGGAGDGH